MASLDSWKTNSPTLEKIRNLVEEVTNKNSKNYLPPLLRLAVFDQDGTIVTEKMPFCVMYDFFRWRVLYDKTYKCKDADAQKIAEQAEACSQQIYAAKGTDTTRFIKPVNDIAFQLCNVFYSVSDGLSVSEYCEVIDRYLNTTNQFYNTKCKNVYFKPMKQLIDYLHENEFSVVVLTGTDRTFSRQLLCDTFNIERWNVIGTDAILRSPEQNEEMSYFFNYENEHDELRMKYIFDPNPSYTVNNKKVEFLIKQVGIIPQIVVGNSKSDAALLNYCLHGSLCSDESKIKPIAALLSQDNKDFEPFYNNVQNNENLKYAKKYGFDTITTSLDFEELFEWR